MRAWLALLMLAAAPVAQAQTPQVRAGAMAVTADDVEGDVAFAGAGDEQVRGRMDGHSSDTGCRLALAVVRAGIGSGLGVMVRETVLAAMLVVLSLFSLYWRIAGTTLDL